MHLPKSSLVWILEPRGSGVFAGSRALQSPWGSVRQFLRLLDLVELSEIAKQTEDGSGALACAVVGMLLKLGKLTVPSPALSWLDPRFISVYRSFITGEGGFWLQWCQALGGGLLCNEVHWGHSPAFPVRSL